MTDTATQERTWADWEEFDFEDAIKIEREGDAIILGIFAGIQGAELELTPVAAQTLALKLLRAAGAGAELNPLR